MNAFLARKLVTFTPSGPSGTAVFQVGVGLFPYLADHGVQDIMVLPGAFFLELACCLHLDCLHASLGRIKRAEFLQPLILSDREISICVEVERIDTQAVRYSFSEAGEQLAGEPPCATLEIEGARPPDAPRSGLMPEAFQRGAEDLGAPAAFYAQLRENGNRYGPLFQGLRRIWRGQGRALGRLAIPPGAAETGSHHLHPALVDSAIQLLAAIFLDQRRTFVLRGIEELSVRRTGVSGPMWVYATLRPESNSGPDGLIGDLEVCDDSGDCWLELRGVRATYLSSPRPSAEIVVAATFTAEPIAEALQFWSDYLPFPARTSFAPYNQVFQELLDPSSQFHQNRGGFNVILLNLADWAAGRPAPSLAPDPERVPADWADLARHTLPNGLEVAHLNRYETESVYREIFDDRCYLRHGIDLAGAATVIDIGANIGLFSLFVRGHCPAAAVYAFEPSPVAYRALKANCEAYGPRLHPFNVGISDRRGSAQLTFYEKSSVFSSFHPNRQEDRRAIQAVVANRVRAELRDDAESVDEYVEELLSDRLDLQRFECPLLSVSDIIRGNGLRRVDLLKVDAEKCELEILRGIEDHHWPLIAQVVVEVHDPSGRVLGEVQEILARKGFRCAVEEEPLLAGSGLCNVYAIRRGGESPPPVESSVSETLPAEVQGNVDGFVQALEGFTQTARAAMVLCLCPRKPNRAQGPACDQMLAACEDRLLQRIRPLSQVHVIASKEILARYPAAQFHNPPVDGGGHVPYTAEGFAALGTSLFRTFVALRRPPFKVIALDCDRTLWQDACGEVGPLGVVVTPAHRRLQEFMLRQMEAGMILCLCSKNNESDVWAVFAQNPGMVLTRGQLSSARINWAPKSENLRSLAEEFNVGLDSLVLLDDNPAECAEVRANCPGALVLRLPADSASWPHFLDHVWAFDHLGVTAEDRRRTQMMQEGGQRAECREQASSLKDFIEGLCLEVTVFEPAPDQMGRLSQLTLRTNQFNFTTVRRSESDLRGFLEADGGRCLAVRVRDRFGDYGMVGLLLFQSAGERCRVDTFLLSCRVLGRGVEHQVLAELGRRALREGRKWVDLIFLPTDRNQPAGDFIRSVGAEFMRPLEGGEAFPFPAAKLAGLRYEPATRPTGREGGGEGRAQRPVAAGVPPGSAEKFAQIADRFRGLDEIGAAIDAHRFRGAGSSGKGAGGELPATLGGRLLGLWRKTLGNPSIGMNDHFLEVGGTSLKAVQIAAAIRRELRLRVSVVTFFECPTVRLLCEKLQPGADQAVAAGDAMERGARRKQRLGTRESTRKRR